eukprot:GFUD01025631.1.p1 GENE.GFUD01025631.1~~GFUD01025631.1.p1  ORF type:complete len:224 (+),score=38.25 GFUD01025631.1:45-716(+)
MNTFLIASCLVAAAIAAPDAEAEPGYLIGGHAPYNAYPNWPGVSTPYSSSTCFGCRPAHHWGKRSAEAEPGYLAYGLGHGYGYGVPLGLPYNGAVHGINQLHPTGHSFQHVARGKRSADAEPGYLAYGHGLGHGYGYPLAYGYGLHGVHAHGLGVAGHPGHATSFVARSPQGLGKRSADAEPGYGYYGYGVLPVGSAYGIHQAHPSGHSYQHVSRAHGFGYHG